MEDVTISFVFDENDGEMTGVLRDGVIGQIMSQNGLV